MKLINAFKHAFRGFGHALKHEMNFKIQFVVAAMVIMLGYYLNINSSEWIFIIGTIVLVLSLELLNSAIEKTCNLISKEYHPAIKIIKDIAAGAVLLAALGASIIGGIIFLPKIIQLIK